jgi:hypothetical protein
LQASSNLTEKVEEEYIPRDDESEAAMLGNKKGVITLDIDDVRSYSLVDYGMGIK